MHHNKAFGGAEEGGARADTEQRKGEKMQRMGDGMENRERREMDIVEGRRAVGGQERGYERGRREGRRSGPRHTF